MSRLPKTFTLHSTYKYGTVETFLIRERDKYQEYPNIYVKVIRQGTSRESAAKVLILSDTGTGVERKRCPARQNDGGNRTSETLAPDTISTDVTGTSGIEENIATFIELTLNPRHQAPYAIILTHCHYDHICGLQHLLAAGAVTVYASSRNRDYLQPWQNLQVHSLCDKLPGLQAPQYAARFVDDNHEIQFFDEDAQRLETSLISVMHTPGHTPDSLSWYDSQTQVLCVGDMFYEQESSMTRSGSSGAWDREPQQPVCFTKDSSISDWSMSMHRLLDFVRTKNRELVSRGGKVLHGYRQNGRGTAVEFEEHDSEDGDWSIVSTKCYRDRVSLSAGHVTVDIDAELALLNMLDFMLQLQLDLLPRSPSQDLEGNEDVWLWKRYPGKEESTDSAPVFSVRAPWSVIHPNRKPPALPTHVDAGQRLENTSILLKRFTNTRGNGKHVGAMKTAPLTGLSTHHAQTASVTQ